jgi:hypothetical protein
MQNAQLAQQNSQYNAGLGLNYNQLNQQTAAQNAQLQQQAGLANQSMAGQYGLAQGQLNQGANAANLQAQQNQQQMNNSMVSSLYGQQGSLYGNMASGSLNLAQSEQGAQLANNAQQFSQGQAIFGDSMQVSGAMMQAMAMSDEDQKSNIKPVQDTSEAGVADEINKAGQYAAANLATPTNFGNGSGGSQSAAAQNAVQSGSGSSSAGSSSGGSSSGMGGMMSSMMSKFGGSGSSSASSNTGEGGSALSMGSDMDIESDERAKKDIHDDDYQTQNFLDALKAHTYQYKNPEENGKGRFMGVMAQELEKTGIGKQAVVETPKGKMVDYARLASVMLAGQVLQNEQIKQLRMEIKDLKGMK